MDEDSVRKSMSIILPNESGADSPGCFVCGDFALECSCCGYEIFSTSYYETVEREAVLFTLHHGAVVILVTDLR